MRWRARIDALKDRLITNDQYLNVLKKMLEKIQNKNDEYVAKENKLLETLQKTK